MDEKIYAIASDIHGSAIWCEKFLTAAKSAGAESFLLLGDLLYHGPRNNLPEGYDTKKTVALLSAEKDKIVCVRGNCDSEVDQMVLPFPLLADYAPVLLQSGGKNVELFLTHGHLFNAEKPPLLHVGQILFNGHFHVPCKKAIENGAYYFNCGSVSLPKENSPHSFVLLKGCKFSWIDIETGNVFDEYIL